MTSKGSRTPQAATVEDWDENTQTTLPGSRASANVTKKRSQTFAADVIPVSDKKSQDGSDSGYSSKTATTADSTPSVKKPSPILDDIAMDRAPQPYSHTPASTKSSKPARTPSVKIQEPPKEKSQRSPKKDSRPKCRVVDGRYVHDRGVCVTCDRFGFHIELPPERPATTAPIHSQPPSGPIPPTTKDDGAVHSRPRPRRSSSKNEQRPQSMYVGIPTHHQQHMALHTPVFDYGLQQPVHPHYDWSAPPSMVGVQSYSYGYPTAPLSTSFSDQNSFLGVRFSRPVTSQPYDAHHMPKVDPRLTQPKPQKAKQEGSEKPVRAKPNVRKSSKDRELEKLAMPPPPRPSKPVPFRRRSSTGQSASSKTVKMRPVLIRDENEYSDDYSSYSSDDEEVIVRRPASQEIKLPQKPPTSWKKGLSPAELLGSKRPGARKSVSYSDEVATTNVASSRPRARRQSTDPLEVNMAAMNRRLKDAEAHQAKTSGGTIHVDLATQMRQKFLKEGLLASEADTDISYQSSSQASRKGRRASTVLSQPTQITFDSGLSLHIPQEGLEGEVRFQYNNVMFSLNPTTPDGLRSESHPFEHMKQIEKAPSTTSKDSRRSGTSAGNIEDILHGRDIPRSSGHIDHSKTKANSSKRSHRTSSVSKRSSEFSRRDFPDYSLRPEQYYGA